MPDLKRFKGTIYLVYDDDRWTVHTLTSDESLRRAKAGWDSPFLFPPKPDPAGEAGGPAKAPEPVVELAKEPSAEPAKEGPGYTWGFRNASGAAVVGPSVDFPRGGEGATGSVAVMGPVAPGATAGGGFGVSPVPDHATVSWSAGGTEHEQKVPVPAVADPAGFDGILWVEFGPGRTVKVTPVTRAEARAAARR